MTMISEQSQSRVGRGTPRRLSPRSAVEAVAEGDRTRAAETLLELSATQEAIALPREFLAASAKALQSGNWDFFGEAFARHDFLGQRGEMLIVAPYTARRMAGSDTKLSALWAKVIPHRALPDPEDEIKNLFGALRQSIPKVLPLIVTASAGMIADEGGEAFIVPDGWPEVKTGTGPALNNMREQRRRFTDSGEKCLWGMFDPASAEFLTRPLRKEAKAFQVQHAEYQMHDYGHASGLGLVMKLQHEVLTSAWYRAVEEWRADGVAFELAARLLSPDRAAELVASNLCTRLGLDAQRRGGLDRDTDVLASLLTFNYLIQSDAISIGPSGRLAVTDLSAQGLLRAVELQRAEAVKLTRREMEQADPHAIWRLYAFEVPHSAEILFEEYVVKPCAGIYRDLR